MTEAQWLASTDPWRMLCQLIGEPGEAGRSGMEAEPPQPPRFPTTERKMRLFMVACCRDVWSHLTDTDSRNAVRVAELYADGLATWGQLSAAHDGARWARDRLPADKYSLLPQIACATTAAQGAVSFTMLSHRVPHATQAGLLRELVGNPFRPPTLCAACPDPSEGYHAPDCPVTPDATALALGAYEERDGVAGHLDHARLGVLADALEEAGATDAALLTHLRGPGPHCRGCWPLDAVLGMR